MAILMNQPAPRTFNKSFEIPEEVMDNLLFRFIHNLPDHEKSSSLAIMTAAEKAHWYYYDFHVTNEFDSEADAECRITYPKCKHVKFKPFVQQLFNRCVFGVSLKNRVHELVENYRRHKHDVPTFGLILLDETLNYVLLVRGYHTHGSWSFPKGKMNDDEIPVQCAIREVNEEVGYDATENVRKSRRFKHEEHGRSSCFFVALNVPMDYKFKPRVRKEISKIAWFSIDDLPSALGQDEQCKAFGPNFRSRDFFHVLSFVEDLRKYVKKRRSKAKRVAEKTPKIQILQRMLERVIIGLDGSITKCEQPLKSQTKPEEEAQTKKMVEVYQDPFAMLT